jgi:hypothetical protein
MSNERDEPMLSERAGGLVDLARRSLGEMSDRQRITGLHGLRVRLLRERRARRALWGAFALAGAAACAVAFVQHRRGEPALLSFRVEGADLQSGGSVRASGSERPVLRFSDGSEIALGEGAHVHVRSIDDRGAGVTLDEGEAHVYVVHARETRWAFDAGPFVIAVTGTAFGLSWHASTQRLDVRLENGNVNVSGPASDAPLSLRAGQWLTVKGSDVLIRPMGPEEPFEETASGPQPSPAPAGGAGAADSIQGGAAASLGAGSGAQGGPVGKTSIGTPAHARADHPEGAGRRHWPVDLASGRFDAIVDQAVAWGLDSAFAQSSADELAALADAARYTRRQDVARGALDALRHRFPGSEQARVAAFYLGKMAETERDPRAALTWFDAYLSEAPNGKYASEALGRKMTLVQLLEGRQAARSLAEAYLRRFPGGTYAEAALALTAAP